MTDVALLVYHETAAGVQNIPLSIGLIARSSSTGGPTSRAGFRAFRQRNRPSHVRSVAKTEPLSTMILESSSHLVR